MLFPCYITRSCVGVRPQCSVYAISCFRYFVVFLFMLTFIVATILTDTIYFVGLPDWLSIIKIQKRRNFSRSIKVIQMN